MRTKGAKNKYNLYFDMDGVLADFNGEPRAVERFENEIGFFKWLEPIKENVNAVKELINDKKVNVYILSASPNVCADNDKIEWLKKYLPTLKKSNIIIMRNGKNKADYVKTKHKNILFDDYGKNVIDFIKSGYNGFKITNDKNINYWWNWFQSC